MQIHIADNAEYRDHIDGVRALVEPLHRTYFIVTFGCQMNVRDSETLSGMLDEMGYSRASRREEADLVLFNTCCVRENAENKALGNVIWLKELKKIKPHLIIGVGGCMMQEQGMAERLHRAYPFIDFIFGTHNPHHLPKLLRHVLSENASTYEVLDIDGHVIEGLPVRRGNPHSAYITIMYGCNNFCSYCIVPYVRGRERSRAMQDILDEAKGLVDQGTREITLLGQNVNSYLGGGAAFAELLYRLDRTGIDRVRFMTSHPKDLSDELIAAYGELKSVQKHLHLPVQSGSDRILHAMNRQYSRDDYLTLVNKLRSVVPEIGLTTDIIVGFPNESEAEFQDTMELIKTVRYDAAFTFIYSKRQGTSAARMEDTITEAEKVERIEALIAVQSRIGGEILAQQIGRVQSVLVDSTSARDDRMICGKTGRSHMVNFPGNKKDIGNIVDVRITSAGRNTLRGEEITAQDAAPIEERRPL